MVGFAEPRRTNWLKFEVKNKDGLLVATQIRAGYEVNRVEYVGKTLEEVISEIRLMIGGTGLTVELKIFDEYLLIS